MQCTTTTELDDQAVELSFSTINYTAITLQSREEFITRFIAISEDYAIATSDETLYLLQQEENTSRIIAKRSLQGPPSELHALEFEEDVFVAVNYDGNSVHVFKYSHRHNGDGLKVWGNYHLKPRHVSNSRLVLSIHLRNDRLYINVIHVIQYNLIRVYDVNHKYNRGIVELPSGCVCSHPNCLKTVYNNQGQVIVDCAIGNRFLCNTFEEEFFPLPSSVHQIVTSKVNRFLAVAIMHLDSLNQDLLLILHFSDQDGDSTSVVVAIAQPERIFDVDTICMNSTDQELVFFVSNNTLQYFMLKENNEFPDIHSMSMPPNVTVGEIQATTDLLLAVEFEYENNTIVSLIDATMTEQEDVTSSESSNETVTSTSGDHIIITPSIVPSACKQQTQTVTKYVTVTTSVMMLVPSDSTHGIDTTVTSPNNLQKHNQTNQEIIILLALILIVLMVTIVFVILIAFFQPCKHHQ